MHDHGSMGNDGGHNHGHTQRIPGPPTDTRMDIQQAILARPAEVRPLVQRNSHSTVALVDGQTLKKKGNSYVMKRRLLRDVSNFCSGQSFIDQQFGAAATGFLVAPNVVLTASHNLPNGVNSLLRLRFVFGFEMVKNKPVLTFGDDDVYEGVDIIDRGRTNSGGDWALVRLDRPVTDRDPLPYRKTGKIGDKDEVYVVGHPFGVPQKLAGNAPLTDNNPKDAFYARLDAFRGNSGSPVFNAKTNEVEGILIGGPLDMLSVDDKNTCVVVHTCDGKCPGELIVRITEVNFAHLAV